MDKVNKQELRRLAEKALPEAEWFEAGHLEHPNIDKSAARFMAFAKPAAILSLLDELEKVDSDRKACWAEFKALRRSADDNERYLREELEQYRKDAERYRWLREISAATTGTVPMVSKVDESGSRVGVWVYGEKLDAVMDAAMAKEGGANG